MIDHLEGKRLVVCIDNQGNEASLEQWKIYQALPDEEAERHDEIRVIDEEGEDYLYPSVFLLSFLNLLLPGHSSCKIRQAKERDNLNIYCPKIQSSLVKASQEDFCRTNVCDTIIQTAAPKSDIPWPANGFVVPWKVIYPLDITAFYRLDI